MSTQPCDLPPDALLRKYREAGAYTDCYATEIAARVSHAEYVEAFHKFYSRVLLAAARSRLARHEQPPAIQ